ncbi:MAG TPA: hypothetical protein VIJ29_01725 [Candidatus Paceibacterota bacterium]
MKMVFEESPRPTAEGSFADRFVGASHQLVEVGLMLESQTAPEENCYLFQCPQTELVVPSPMTNYGNEKFVVPVTALVFNAQDVKSSLHNKLLFDIPFADYLSRFDDLSLLSKQSFSENALDAYAERIGKKFQRVPISALSCL